MLTTQACVFCDHAELLWRTIRVNKLFISLVSSPRFRPGQCLVGPVRHLTTPDELNEAEAGAIMLELGRLSGLLDAGFGAGIMQKYQPLQPENGIKVNHLHFHVFPRLLEEPELFPVPQPNSFAGFSTPPREEIKALADRLR